MFGVGNGTLRLPVPSFTSETASLGQLLATCMDEDPAQRPSFAAILEHLLEPVATQLGAIEETTFAHLQAAWRAQVSTVQRIRCESGGSSSFSSFAPSGWASGGDRDGGSICYLGCGIKRRRILVPRGGGGAGGQPRKWSCSKQLNFETKLNDDKENVYPLETSFHNPHHLPRKGTSSKRPCKRKFSKMTDEYATDEGELDENANKKKGKDIWTFLTTTTSAVSGQSTSSSSSQFAAKYPWCHQAKKLKRSLPPKKKTSINSKKLQSSIQVTPFETAAAEKTQTSATAATATSDANKGHRFPLPTAVDANLVSA